MKRGSPPPKKESCAPSLCGWRVQPDLGEGVQGRSCAWISGPTGPGEGRGDAEFAPEEGWRQDGKEAGTRVGAAEAGGTHGALRPCPCTVLVEFLSLLCGLGRFQSFC